MAQPDDKTCTLDPRRSFVIKKDQMQVIALTDRFRVEGTAHFIPQARISDFMNRADIHFIPLTDATLSDLKTGERIYAASFFCLNKSDVVVMIPKDDLA